MSRIQEGKHNYLFYKYIQIHIVGGLYLFFWNCSSCNQLTPSRALQHSKEKEYSYGGTQLCIVSKKFNNFYKKNDKKGNKTMCVK